MKIHVSQSKNVLKNLDKNYENNLNTDYTEKIEELDKNFEYDVNCHHYWSEPKFSVCYGTPLYESASHSQKLILNHIYWTAIYKTIRESEIEVLHHNLSTAGCLRLLGNNYENISCQLEHETTQEHCHIHAFNKVCFKTLKVLLGRQAFTNRLGNDFYKQVKKIDFSTCLAPSLQLLTKNMLKSKKGYFSPYFVSLEESNKSLSSPTAGFFNGFKGNRSESLKEFMTVNWGSSPFLACNFYVVRYLGNLDLKNVEHNISKYYKKLQKQEQFIPAPTAISHLHFLDESFHTTSSLFLGRDFYKQYLPAPSLYEKFIANISVYLVQRDSYSQISGIMPNRCIDDSSLIVFLYNLLISDVFGMSSQDALYWIKKCLCQEHEGFYLNSKNHQNLLSDFRRFTNQIDYLWPVNREMSLMASGCSIYRAIKNNIQVFERFSQFIESKN